MHSLQSKKMRTTLSPSAHNAREPEPVEQKKNQSVEVCMTVAERERLHAQTRGHAFGVVD